MRSFLKIILILFLAIQVAVAQNNNQHISSQKPLIVSSINPIQQIISAVVGDKTNNVLIIKSGLSEHDYHLKKNDVEMVNKANLIFYVSDDLERNFAKLSSSQDKKLDTFQLIKIDGIKLLQKRNDAKTIDPHIWLNPQNGVRIAQFVVQKISAIDPKNSLQYQENFEKFRKEVLSTEQKIKLQISKKQGLNYIFFHDGYQYFEDYFGIKSLKVVSGGHDSELSLAAVKEIDALIKQSLVNCIVGEQWDEKNTAQKLANNYKITFSELDLSKAKSYTEMLQKIANSCSF